MSIKNNEKETLIGLGMLLISVFFFISVFFITDKGDIFISPRLVPFIVTSFMILLSLLYFIKHAVKGFPKFSDFKETISLCFKKTDFKSTFWSIVIVAIYIFIGIPIIGFYVSSVGLISFILIKYSRKPHPAWAVLISIITSGVFYLIFGMILHLSLR